jgi:hypothetical protein
MTPDLRINLHYPPPLPRSLLGIMGIALLSLVASTAFFAVSYRVTARGFELAAAKRQEIEKAKQVKSKNDLMIASKEAALNTKKSLQVWKDASSPSAPFAASAIVAVLDTETQLIQRAKEELSKDVSQQQQHQRSKLGARTKSKDSPSLTITALAYEMRSDTGRPELRVEIAHNLESRSGLVPLLTSQLTKYTPVGYTLARTTPDDSKPGTLGITLVWSKNT